MSLGNILLAQKDSINNNDDEKIIISFPESSLIENNYTFDPETNRYYLSKSIANYPINFPLVLTPIQYEELILSKNIKTYFKQKTLVIDGKASGLEEAQKNLLPELYINNKYFQSIFGSDVIEINPSIISLN